MSLKTGQFSRAPRDWYYEREARPFEAPLTIPEATYILLSAPSRAHYRPFYPGPPTPPPSSRHSSARTFDHDHVDINGADGGLGQPFPLLQQVRDLSGWDPIIRFGPKSHQLPHSHTWSRDEVKR